MYRNTFMTAMLGVLVVAGQSEAGMLAGERGDGVFDVIVVPPGVFVADWPQEGVWLDADGVPLQPSSFDFSSAGFPSPFEGIFEGDPAIDAPELEILIDRHNRIAGRFTESFDGSYFLGDVIGADNLAQMTPQQLADDLSFRYGVAGDQWATLIYAVPEPSTLAFLITGLLGVLTIPWRRLSS